MVTQIFVNLPVRDLKQSVECCSKLGFTFDPQFSDEQATCMIVSENLFVMLLVERCFRSVSNKELCNATKNTEVIVCLSTGSRKKVDEMVSKAVAAGGATLMEFRDHGCMY
jgi:uncharacterized protein